VVLATRAGARPESPVSVELSGGSNPWGTYGRIQGSLSPIAQYQPRSPRQLDAVPRRGNGVGMAQFPYRKVFSWALSLHK
jgi:hypothetical protein